MTIALECRNLGKNFAQTPAVHDFNLTVKPGEFVTLLGHSGCGKTTTLRLIAGFEAPDSGSIHINGNLIADNHTSLPAEKRQVGMVFQDYALFPHVNVADNIAFGLKGKRKDKSRRVKDMLALVNLDGYGQRMPHELSGGQQQRVALARALAPAPDILLLDEPFSNLDTALRGQVRTEIRQILRDTQTTAIFVTHDQEEALSLSDKVAVMFAGEAVQIDAPHIIYRSPISRQVAQFVGEANFVPATATGTTAQSILGTTKLQNNITGKVDLLIRPEMIQFTDDGVPAKIIWQEYYGHSQRIGLQLTDGTRLISRASSTIPRLRDHTIKFRVTAPVHAYHVD